jgi:myo-inositol 2-dehydrogenase / D-chiro-inositol 1-dehydrogenase
MFIPFPSKGPIRALWEGFPRVLEKEMIRFGILGAGRIGKVHTATIGASKVAKVAYVADAVAKAASDLAATVGAKTASVEEIIASKDVDAILIATPTGTHADLIEAASNAGKAILCEKPVSLSVERILSCLKVVEKNKSNLMIGFNRRFDPNFAALQKRISNGDIGTVELATIISRDPGPPPLDYIPRSGGLYRDMMIHDFDMARFLVAEEFVTVHALGASLVDKEIGRVGDVDTAVVHMQTASGKICVITCSRRATYGYDQRMEVHGSKGMLSAGNIHNSTVAIANAQGYNADPLLHFFTERYALAYGNEVKAFIDGIASGKTPRPNGFDGLMAQKLADAATESWKSGKAVKVQ